MNTLRAVFDRNNRIHKGHRTHADQGNGNPLCNGLLDATHFVRWQSESNSNITCPICLRRLQNAKGGAA